MQRFDFRVFGDWLLGYWSIGFPWHLPLKSLCIFRLSPLPAGWLRCIIYIIVHLSCIRCLMLGIHDPWTLADIYVSPIDILGHHSKYYGPSDFEDISRCAKQSW